MVLVALTAAPLLSLADEGAKSLVMAGNNRGATACVACHGVDGGGTAAAGFPRLAGLNASYIAHQLQGFRSGKRNNAVMQPIAKALTDTEIKQLAAYYAALPIPAVTPAASDAALLKTGETLATKGDWDHGIPACFQCHGPLGKGIGDDFPAITGQSALYISNQIEAWKSGTRSNDPVGLMKSVADKLTAEQVKAVAAFLANQPLSMGNQK